MMNSTHAPFDRHGVAITLQRLAHTAAVERLVGLLLGVPGGLVLVCLALWLVVYGMKHAGG